MKDTRKLKQLFPDDPELLEYFERKVLADDRESLKNYVHSVIESEIPKIVVPPGEKGDKGDKGDIGETPEIDYEKIISESIKLIPTPKDGKDGKDGKTPRDGYTPIKGKDYFDGKDGKDGKDTDTSDILEKVIEELKKNKRLELRDIKGARLDMSDQRWHGGGISNITGLIQAGTNVTITGSGTSGDPYIINSSGGGGSQTPWLSDIDADEYDLFDLGSIKFRGIGELFGMYDVIGSTTAAPGNTGPNGITLAGVYDSPTDVLIFTYTVTDQNATVLPVDDTTGFAAGDPVEDSDFLGLTGTVLSIFEKTIVISTSDDWSTVGGVTDLSTFTYTFFTATPYLSDIGTLTDGTTTIIGVPINTPLANLYGIWVKSTLGTTGHDLGDSWSATTGFVENLGLSLNFRTYDYSLGDVNSEGYGNLFSTRISNSKTEFFLRDKNRSYLSMSGDTGLYEFGPSDGTRISINDYSNEIILGASNVDQVYVKNLITGGVNGFVGYDGSNGRLFTRPNAIGTGTQVGGYGTGVMYVEGGTLLYEPEFRYITNSLFEVGDGSGNAYIYADFLNNRLRLRDALGGEISIDAGDFFMRGNNVSISTPGGDNVLTAIPSTGTVQFGDIPLLGASGILTVNGQAGTVTSSNLDWDFNGGTLNDFSLSQTTASGAFSVNTETWYWDVDTSGGTATPTLPLAAAVSKGTTVVISDYLGNALLNPITVTASGSDTIEGAGTKVINANYGSLTLHSDGVSVWVST